MKLISLVLFFFSGLSCFAQSTKIHFTDIDRYQRIFNDLNNVKFVEFVCKDKSAQGKYFSIDLVRFVKGKPDTISKGLSNCGEIRLPVKMANGDTAYYLHDPCHSSLFSGDMDSMVIALAGKQQDSILHLLIDKNYSKEKYDIHGQPTFVLQNATGENIRTVEYNKAVPLALYFGGYKSGIGTFYCLAKTVKAEEMFQKFQVEDYYVFYLTIKD